MIVSRVQWKGWDGGRFSTDVRKIAGRGLGAAALHLTNRIKQVISVPAPRKIVKFTKMVPVMKKQKLGKTGRFKYVAAMKKVTTKRIVAATPATPGAPPRKLTGKLRQSIAWQWMKRDTVARVGTNIEYAAPLEFGPKKFRGKSSGKAHPFISVTLQRAKGELNWIMWNSFNKGIASTTP